MLANVIVNYQAERLRCPQLHPQLMYECHRVVFERENDSPPVAVHVMSFEQRTCGKNSCSSTTNISERYNKKTQNQHSKIVELFFHYL